MIDELFILVAGASAAGIVLMLVWQWLLVRTGRATLPTDSGPIVTPEAIAIFLGVAEKHLVVFYRKHLLPSGRRVARQIKKTAIANRVMDVVRGKIDMTPTATKKSNAFLENIAQYKQQIRSGKSGK